MKIILSGLFLAFNLYANIEVSQNIRALYKGVKLTEIQENYILDNQDFNIDQLEKTLKRDLKAIRSKYINEKNVISFILTPTGEITNIKFLRKSDSRKIDNITKKAINKNAKRFKKPKEDTIMRFIISFKKGKINRISSGTNSSSNIQQFYQNISQGTTRFQHQSKEYVRTFETHEDGFINLSINPFPCMQRITLLTSNNQLINVMGVYSSRMNKEIPKGKYKLLLKTKRTCNVNLEYQ